MLVVALCNQKGGVGKTTTAFNLARAAHLRGIETLIGDLDPQANTTSTLLGQALDTSAESVADVLSARSDATSSDVIVKTGWQHVQVLPSGGDALADVGTELVAMGPGREHRLREALSPLVGAYELVLLDCPPALDLLTINALTAAQEAVIVTTAALWSSDGIARLLATLDAVQKYSNASLHPAGVIVNGLERTRRQRHWHEELLANSPVAVWGPPVPKLTWIAEAAEAGVGLDEWNTPAASNLLAVYDQYLSNILEGTSHR